MADPTSQNAIDSQFTCLYFGFASNLSPRTIKQRCPSALYVGLGVLPGWKFVVSELGFGNIVPGSDDDVVFGSLNFLNGRDEAALDQSEEVPSWHEKKTMKVMRLNTQPNLNNIAAMEGDEVEITTYVDVQRVGTGVISKDYVVWLRKAIADGLKCGIPDSYFEKYFNEFLPEDASVGKEDQIMMIRTVQMDKHDTRHVPSDVLRMAGKEDVGK